MKLDARIPDTTMAAMHEFGHMIGMDHEHQRRIAGLDLDMKKIEEDMNFYPTDELLIGSYLARRFAPRSDPFLYDSSSIMHYAMPRGGVKGLPEIERPWTLSTKDQQLTASWYPRPYGAFVDLNLRQAVTPGLGQIRGQKQAVCFPQPWYIPPRIFLGVAQCAWKQQSDGWAINLRANDVNPVRQRFLLDAKVRGLANRPRLVYLALDPTSVGLQTSSSMVHDETENIPLSDGVETWTDKYMLKAWTSTSLKIIPWVRSFTIADSTSDFFFAVNIRRSLAKDRKEICVERICSKGVSMEAQWLAISREAININGGVEDWSYGKDLLHFGFIGFDRMTKRRADGTTREPADADWRGTRSPTPTVILSITRLEYVHCRHHGSHEPSFKLGLLHEDFDGFSWSIETCHDDCIPALQFSWVAMVKSEVAPFRLPAKSDPKRPREMTEKGLKRYQEQIDALNGKQSWDEKEDVDDTLYEGLEELFLE